MLYAIAVPGARTERWRDCNVLLRKQLRALCLRQFPLKVGYIIVAVGDYAYKYVICAHESSLGKIPYCLILYPRILSVVPNSWAA